MLHQNYSSFDMRWYFISF